MKPETKEIIEAWVAATVGVIVGTLKKGLPVILAYVAGGIVLFHCANGAIGSQPGEYWAVTSAMLAPYISIKATDLVKKVIKK